MLKRLSVFPRRARGAAVGRHDDLEVTHVGVVRGAENAAVGREAGKDDGRRAEFPQQEVERRLIKGRMHRLEDEIIFVVGPELFDEVKARRLGPQAVLQQLLRIRPPLAEIVVDIDRRNACRAGLLLQAGKRRRNRERLAEDVFSVRKLEMIDHIDEEERDARFMADIARGLFHDLGSRWGRRHGGRLFALEPRQHVLHRELAARFKIVELVPGKRQGDRRAWSCPHGIIGDGRRRVVVAEEVDEDFPVRLALVMVAT